TRDKRAPSAPRPVLVRRLLSPLADPSVARQRLPGCSPHPTAKQRQGDCDSASRRASPSLRTPRRLTCFPRLHHLLRSPTVWRAMPSRAESRWRTPTAQTDQRDREINSCVSSHPTRRSPESDTRWSFAQAQGWIGYFLDRGDAIFNGTTLSATVRGEALILLQAPVLHLGGS